MKRLSIALLLVVLASSAAIAQSDQPGERVAGPSAAGGEDEEIVVEGEVPKERRKVCQMRVSTGSIVPKRVCRTAAQVEADERAARDTLEHVNRDRETRDTIQANR